MKRNWLWILGLALLAGILDLSSAQVRPARAQDTTDEDMRFVNALRQRGDNDLAREFLERMKKNPSPALALVLPLEIAKTRLAEAADEPDSVKRLAMLTEARQQFEAFVAANPKNPRAAEAKLDIAQVAVLQGKLQLSKALSQDNIDSKRAEGAKARTLLQEAGKKLKEVTKELDIQLEKTADPKTPAEKAARLKAEEERNRAELSIGVNLLDQALSYPATDPSTEVLKERGKQVLDAMKVLEKVAGGDPGSSLTWQAKAWLGRCYHENGDGNKARGRYTEILEAPRGPAAGDGQRLARYFRLLVIEEDPTVKDKVGIIEESATRWIRDYPRQKTSPEGCGIRFMLARIHIGKAEDTKLSQKIRDAELDKARTLLGEIEQSENAFTERARKLKLAVLSKQGAFTKKVEELKKFDDCYIRAQYENQQMAELVKKNPDKADEYRKKGIETVLAVLDRGLNLPDARGKKTLEIGEARFMQVFYLSELKRSKDVIQIGEAFVKDNPASPSGSKIAVRVLMAYGQLINGGEANLTASEMEDLRKKMTDFNKLVQARWGRDEAGDFARGQHAEMLLAQIQKVNDPPQRAQILGEVVKTINALSPGYAYFVPYQDLLAEIALKAEQEKTPLPDEPGQPKLTYRQRAMAALERVPDVDGSDPFVNVHYLNARCLLVGEIFKEKKYDQMEKMTVPLLQRLPNLRLSNDDKKNGELHENFQTRLVGLNLYAKYGLAEAAFTAGDMVKVSTILDPLVDDVLAKKDHPIRNNAQLGHALMDRALRSSVQQGKIDRARLAVKALQQFSEGDPNGAITVLRQLVAVINKQVEELKQKGDRAKLQKAIEGFSSILDDLKSKATMTPPFMLAVASCYSSMEQHKKAAELLTKVNKELEQKKDDEESQKLHRGSQILLIRQLRLGKDEKDLKEAKAMLDTIMGTKDKPGWGARNIEALKEQVHLLVAEGKYVEGFNRAKGLTKQLTPKIDIDNAVKNHYLECYYEMVYCMCKYGQGLKDEKKKDKTIGDAAKMIDELEKKYPDRGSDASNKRFEDLLKSEPELNTHYKKVKTTAAAAG